MNIERKYEQPPRMSCEELENVFLTGDGQRIGTALLSAFYTEEPNWVLKWCLRFVDHHEVIARRSAIEVLGNIAFLRHDEVDLTACREAAEKLRGDLDQEVRVAAQDALEDVLHAIKLREA